MLRNQLSNLRAENLISLRNLRADPKNGVAYKKTYTAHTAVPFLIYLVTQITAFHSTPSAGQAIHHIGHRRPRSDRLAAYHASPSAGQAMHSSRHRLRSDILSVLLDLEGLTLVEILLSCFLLMLLFFASDLSVMSLFIISTSSCIVIVNIFKLL